MIRDFTDPADFHRSHTNNVERNFFAHTLKHIEAETPAALSDAVDYNNPFCIAPGIQVSMVNDSVFNDGGGNPVIIPHQVIEMGYMYNTNRRIFYDMPGVNRMLTRRIVFQVYPGKYPLLF